ncbi:MAG TPA: hypothetical protein VN758_05120 [Solirubrobacterales bacterium]|nr:hypothetical protein [Solirubrobacterales bacterium]
MSRSDATPQAEPGKLTPEKLIARFCGPLASGLRADPGTTEQEDGTRVSRGWCGYVGGRGDALAVGFQEGYEFMDYLGERGWEFVHDKGNWPYVMYGVWQAGEKRAIIEYCEGDLTLWEFADQAKAREFAEGLN